MLSFTENPQEIQATGIGKGLLEDLALKILHLQGEMSLVDLSVHMCVGVGVVEEIFQFFRKEQLCEVKGMSSSHRIVVSAKGRQRAADLLALSQYAGPAPVSLGDYRARIQVQSVQRTAIGPEDLARAFKELVLGEDVLARLGTAVISGTSAFLYGPSGTGKTSIATAMAAIYNDAVWVPQAVEVDGQIITVYDPGVHQVMEVDASQEPEYDKRWLLCRRPCVFVGGELTAEMLDLPAQSSTRYYTAPLQMKANNGVLIVDDFGRQRMRPEELLNRWMTPLDRRIDFLTLPGGRKFEIPFDPLLVFSTNLQVSQIADEAFMRRIPNKIKIDYATPAQFIEIFRQQCEARSLPYKPQVPEFVAHYIHKEMKQPLCQCHARDLINQISWEAAYQGSRPLLTRESFVHACKNYFLAGGEKAGASHSSGFPLSPSEEQQRLL